MGLTEDIKQKAVELGFDLVGITDASALDAQQFELFTDWLALGFAGRMGYMRTNLQKRLNPARLLENAKSVMCVGLNYCPPQQPSKPPDVNTPMGTVASYAQYEDYHSFIKKQLRQLTDFAASAVGPDFKYRICVDSAPLAERALAARAGLGFIGKSHMLISPEFGPQILLGEVITSLALKPDEPIKTSCFNCNKCLNACPTGALRPDGQFDASKCISYLTIEYKDQIPPGPAEKIADRLFGCDECILACPWHENSPICKNRQFKFYGDRAKLPLREILDLTPEDFKSRFADSPLKRPGLERLKRNAAVCLKNITSPKA